MGGWGRDLTQKELAELAGTPDLSILETKREPDRGKLEELFSAMGRGPEEVDVAIFCADLLRRPRQPIDSPVEPTPEEARILQSAATLEAGEVFHVTLEQLTQALREAKAQAQRQESEAPFKDLMKRPSAERWRMVEEYEAYRTWALCERVAFASVKVAAHDADAAVELARLAVRMAELTPGCEEWRSRIGGLCWGLLANALRVKGNFPAADEGFVRSDRLWQAGATADPGLILDGTRLLDLKASLRRHQGRFKESLDFIRQALSVSQSREATAHLLLVKAFTLKEMGDCQGTIETLQQARPLLEGLGDRRGRFGLEFNLCTALADAGRHAEAEELLPKVRGLALGLGNGLDLLRCRWLRGRISGEQGKLEEAVIELEYVAGELIALGIAFDAAQACLELSQLYLRLGRTMDVNRLANQMVAVFKAQRVHRETLASVIIFQEVAEQERVTAELARKLSHYLRRAEHAPGLHFEP